MDRVKGPKLSPAGRGKDRLELGSFPLVCNGWHGTTRVIDVLVDRRRGKENA
jgi:hypothetical protein